MSEMSPAEEIFFAALEKPSSVDRAAYLDAACAGHPVLRARVEKLLAAHFRVGAFMESDPPQDTTRTFGNPAATGSFRNSDASETAGTIIGGRYKLRQQIGEGGMGTVWMADQTEPVKRKVAVKLIRVDRGQSKSILARFEAERQAIALMDHPHIAKLLDAGTTESGLPFFVMELVKGVPLNEFCDSHKLTITERLNLFQHLCAAVQHAHQKGIIHRDLKPSNILVESHDGKPVPKVIDFGLAKATTGLHLSDQSLFTAFGNVMGTPLYMAPEQATFNAVDVDTRADVYALGVILYELLTGTTPITRDTLKKAAFDEMLRLVREKEVPTPSSRLSSADNSPSVSASRKIEPAKLSQLVRGELDWIVLKALSKDRERRYETANGFARDIERFLNHEPVTAGPPSTKYRFQKFVQRNRGQVIAASLVLLALVGGFVATSYGFYRAERERERANAAEKNAVDNALKAMDAAEAERAAKLDADAKRQEAVGNLAFAKKGNELLGSVFAGLDPKKITESGRPLQDMLRENLVKTVNELEGSAIGDPLEVAAMQNTLGLSLIGLGASNLAVEVLKKASETRKSRLSPDHPDTLASMNNLALAYQASGQLNKALPLIEETYILAKAKFGPDHPDTLTSMNNLALACQNARQYDKALFLSIETLNRRKASLGPNHTDTLASMNNLALAYQSTGQLNKALPLMEETLLLAKAKFGPDHPDTLTSMNNLALACQSARQFDKAMQLNLETLKARKSSLGPDHPDTLASMNNLALAYQASGQLNKALPLMEETLLLAKAKFGPDHPNTLTSMANLGKAYCSANQGDKAAPLLTALVASNRRRTMPDDAGFAQMLTQMSVELLKCEQFSAAQEILQEALSILEKTQPGLWTTDYTKSLLGESLLGQKKYSDAAPLLLNSYEGLKARENSIPPQAAIRIPEILDRLIELSLATKKPDQAMKYRELRRKYPSLKNAKPNPQENK